MSRSFISGRVAPYLIDLLEEMLGPAKRETRFDWCRGDPSPKRPRGTMLPFDACWMELDLIVEINENQHWNETPHFDKPDVVTVSGVHRGIQRRLYDEQKIKDARRRGFTVIVIRWKRPRNDRDPARDRRELCELLAQHGIGVA